jgi:hypothetical protein
MRPALALMNMGAAIAVGVGIGAALFAATGQIVWTAICGAVGAALGAAAQRRRSAWRFPGKPSRREDECCSHRTASGEAFVRRRLLLPCGAAVEGARPASFRPGMTGLDADERELSG